MSTVTQMIGRFKSLDVQGVIASVLEQPKMLEEAAHLQRVQWESGHNSLGGIIGEYESDSYRQEKRRMNPMAGGHVDLMYTHDFERSLRVKLAGDYLVFKSGDWKSDMLQERYGEEIYGLTNESARELAQIASKELRLRFREVLKL